MRSSLSLQRLLFAHQKKQIASLVQPASRPFRNYERRYQRATRTYRTVIEVSDVIARARASDIVYVGDYHTFRPAQDAFAELVEASLRADRRAVLALEFVEGAKQKVLDTYLAGRISERTFLKRIAHPYRGGFESGPGSGAFSSWPSDTTSRSSPSIVAPEAPALSSEETATPPSASPRRRRQPTDPSSSS